ncbi:MAG: hypothetical protein JSU95_02990 [Betaproteobacteria bacterium]|nr:MAG: hypothetical protein JSU95_02990 [Betaproteobacteria bacterium]
MTYSKIAGLVVLTIAATSYPAMADMYAPSHTCVQPIKPYEFNDNDEVAMFNDAVSEYKQCISAFADEQNQTAAVHRSAADEAIDEWNTFLDDNDLN